ncbi:mitochondrial carrier domain-containing protein [Fomitopsis serialis]|uniref:mitochondrial carrier domain-containing protein n=1 Tax=Fomitopsis serialis TaxID=139415 RepID=UPI0020082F36|nr:mitochondrial carrier domain-containing protein [Neoantrodia serialis]KAH9919644.1 mitochondrial carrier domain-containing protein [Neoantrodia serialis]
MAAPQKKPLPFVANFTAGAIAGISEILTFYPLDVVKTRMQLETGKSQHGLVGSFRAIIREEGCAAILITRSLVPPLLLEAPKRATKFAANGFWGKTYLKLTGEAKMNQSLSILTGCTAGATESFVVVPFELVKIKLQDKLSTYSGPMDVVRKVIQKEGVLGMYSGMEATFWRHLWWNGGYFGCIFQVRALLPKPESPKAHLMSDLIAGSVGGLSDRNKHSVVKSRIQGATRVPGVAPKYNWTYPAGAVQGFVPKVLRLAPGGGVLLLVVEVTLGLFRQMLGPPYI